MIRGNMPSYTDWCIMMKRYNKRYKKKELRLNKKFNKGKITKERMMSILLTFKKKHYPVWKYHFTKLEAADFYGLCDDFLPTTSVNVLTGNDIYSFRRVIDNIVFNNTFKRTKVGTKDDNKNREVYLKFMRHFANPEFPTDNGWLFFKPKDSKFEQRERLFEIPTAIYDVINSKLHCTPYHLNVGKNESHLLLTDMMKFYSIYQDDETFNWFNMTDLDVYNIGVIRNLGDTEIRYTDTERYLNEDKSIIFEQVLFSIGTIISEHFSNIEPIMDALGIRFMGILVSPYPLNIQPGVLYKDAFLYDKLNRNIYNFYLIINQKY